MMKYEVGGTMFDFAFFIDQEVNINRKPLPEAVENATKMFLQLYPKWKAMPREELMAKGVAEFNSWHGR